MPSEVRAAEQAASAAPVVSVIIPSIGVSGVVRGASRCFVVEAVRSVLATAGVPVEVLVVAGASMPDEIRADLVSLSETIPAENALGTIAARNPVRLVDYDAPFNFSATVNLGAAHARGRHLLLLNDDTEVVSADWLQRMVAAVELANVGAVGFGLPGDATGRGGLLGVRRLVAGVTAACMLTPMAVFDEVGGFTTLLAGNYNDVDYCMKVRYAGHDIVYEPAAVLHHFESRSRQAGVRPDEIELIQRRWLTQLIDDPFTPAVV